FTSSLLLLPLTSTLSPYTTLFRSFPSGAVAWRIDGEEFWSSFKDVIPTLKLRASYGRLGNQTVGVSTFRQLLGLGKTTWLDTQRSEEHTSELQSRFDIVCRLLLDK